MATMVYLLEYGPRYDGKVVGVFATRELAAKRVSADLLAKDYVDTPQIFEFELIDSEANIRDTD